MIDLSGLSNFTEKARKIYVEEINLDTFEGWEMVKGVSGKEFVNYAEENTVLQSLGCNLTPEGDLVISEREISTCGIENLKDICEDDNTLRFKAVDGKELGKVLTKEYAKGEQKALNYVMFAGNVLSGDVCDGLYKYVEDEAISLSDSTVINTTNIDNVVEALINKAYDLGINEYGVLTIYAPMKYVRMYRQWLKNNAQGAGFEPVTKDSNSFWIPGEEGIVQIKGAYGLATIDDMFISYLGNYMHIEDNDQNKDRIAKWSYVEHTGMGYYKSILYRGVNVKFPNHIVRLR